MGFSVDFKGANKTLGPPVGDDGTVNPMRVFSNGACCVSRWEFSDAEIEEIVKTRGVYLSVLSGQSQPPVFVGGKSEMRDMLSDMGGVWRE